MFIWKHGVDSIWKKSIETMKTTKFWKTNFISGFRGIRVVGKGSLKKREVGKFLFKLESTDRSSESFVWGWKVWLKLESSDWSWKAWQFCWRLNLGDDFEMLLTEFRCWWHLWNVGSRRLCKKTMDVGIRNDLNRHWHLIFVTNTFGVQRPSSISI